MSIGALPLARHGLLFPAVLALVLSAALLLAQRRLDFTVSEEGFLWYGAVAVAHGDVPLRDFYSYDPGRYYWAAVWTPLASEGLLGLRLATAAFAALGLFCGLLAARRAVSSRLALACLGVVLTLWMLPRNKLYEPAIEMAAVLAAVALVERPTRRRHTAAGAMVGFGLFMGKNHGLYLGVAFLALILLLYLRRGGEPDSGGGHGRSSDEDRGDDPPRGESEIGGDDRPRGGSEAGGGADRPGTEHGLRRRGAGGRRELGGRLGAWIGGFALGASPLLVMLAFVPGFLRSYVESVLFFLQQGQTNFARPVPWPWHPDYSQMDRWSAAQTFSIGFCFLLIVVFFAAGGLALLASSGLRLRRHPLLTAAIVIGAVYTHHAFSRADLAHLAPSIHPLLLGLAALPAAAAATTHRPAVGRALKASAAVAVGLLLAGITWATAVPAQPFYQQLTTRVMHPYTILGEHLLLRPSTIELLDWVQRTAAARIPPGAPILLAPTLPGLYPILGRRSPVWNIYPIWPAAGKLDDRMLEELRTHHVEWAFLLNSAVDMRDDLMFRNTYPETWHYLMSNFDVVEVLNPARPWQCTLHHKLPSPISIFVPFLIGVKNKYDPCDVFKFAQSIPLTL